MQRNIFAALSMDRTAFYHIDKVISNYPMRVKALGINQFEDISDKFQLNL